MKAIDAYTPWWYSFNCHQIGGGGMDRTNPGTFKNRTGDIAIISCRSETALL